MMKFNVIKTLMLGICFSTLITGTAYAKSYEEKDSLDKLNGIVEKEAPDYVSAENNDTMVIYSDISDEMIKKQERIDKILFEEKASELESKGISVMETAPMDGYVQVLILPYSQENADFINQLVGEDSVKVAEGAEPELMYTSGIATDDSSMINGAVTAEDVSVSGQEAVVLSNPSIKETLIEDNTNIDHAKNNNQESPVVVIGITGLIIILGGILINQKKKIMN